MVEIEDLYLPNSGQALSLRSFYSEVVMTTAFPPCQNRTDWKSLYAAAILETNKGVLPQAPSPASWNLGSGFKI